MEGNTHKYVAEEGSRDLFCRRAPHGARGLKRVTDVARAVISRRAPHGARGLKLCCGDGEAGAEGRAPHGARGLKHKQWRRNGTFALSRPAWGAWIETALPRFLLPCSESRPVWGAWIETVQSYSLTGAELVAPRMGRVD